MMEAMVGDENELARLQTEVNMLKAETIIKDTFLAALTRDRDSLAARLEELEKSYEVEKSKADNALISLEEMGERLRKRKRVEEEEISTLKEKLNKTVKCKECYRRKYGSGGSGGGLWFTGEMDEKLKWGVAQFGRDWKRVAEYVGNGVNNDQCFQRWKRHVSPEVAALKGKGLWTDAEDQALLEYIAQRKGKGANKGIDWSGILAAVGRTHAECSHRLRDLEGKELKRGHFTLEEDEMIRTMVSEWHRDHPYSKRDGDWKIIGELLNRPASCVQLRWNKLKKGPRIHHGHMVDDATGLLMPSSSSSSSSAAGYDATSAIAVAGGGGVSSAPLHSGGSLSAASYDSMQQQHQHHHHHHDGDDEDEDDDDDPLSMEITETGAGDVDQHGEQHSVSVHEHAHERRQQQQQQQQHEEGGQQGSAHVVAV